MKGFSFGIEPDFFRERNASLGSLNEFLSVIVGEEIPWSQLYKQLDFEDLSWNEDEKTFQNKKRQAFLHPIRWCPDWQTLFAEKFM